MRLGRRSTWGLAIGIAGTLGACGDDGDGAKDGDAAVETDAAADTSETGDTDAAGDTRDEVEDTSVDTVDSDVEDTGDPVDVPPDIDADGPELMLHVPSPDWRDQVIYFVFTDRFDDGDPSNNDQGADEYDPTTTAKYSGGDLQGIIDRLDYIQGLGATAVWITPPVANMWWDPLSQFGGFHGYWARDFTKVDAHQGTLATYQALSDALHRRGMVLIQDVVTNHVGNYFTWDAGAYDPAAPADGFVRNVDAEPSGPAPEQAPFDQNDVTNPAHVAAGIYHWTPAIADYTDPVQEKTWQTSDLDDLNTESPVVREALRASYGVWIRDVGVDGFRIDTAKFVEQSFWNDFLHRPLGDDRNTAGMHAVAATTGRDDFLAFGEVFQVSDPMDDAGDRIVTSYLGTAAEPGLDAVLGFPLYEEISRVVGGGAPTRQLGYRLGVVNDARLYRDPSRTPNFLDNHDVARFLAAANVDALRQALLVLFTVPGIPVVFQGTEQGFTETRAAMFAKGWMSGGVDHFDTSHALYGYVAELAAMRRGTPTLSRGGISVLADSAAGPGLLAYRRDAEGLGGGEAVGDAQGDQVLVLLNTADEEVLVAGLATGITPGLDVVRLAGPDLGITIGPGGEVLTVLPPRASVVLATSDTIDEPAVPEVEITIDTPVEGETFTADVTLTGTVTPGVAALWLVVDGYLGRATAITPSAEGAWEATLAVSAMPYGDNEHTLVVYAEAEKAASAVATFRTNTHFDGQIIEVADALGDDTGWGGTYTYPQDPTFAGGRSMDIERAVVEAGPATLRLKLTMGEHSTVWNPSNGFDHVCFNVYFDVPGLEGLTMLPKIQATVPPAAGAFAWDFTHFAYGWGNQLHKTAGASETVMGGPVPGRPTISVDAGTRTVTFEYAAATFGLEGWGGVQIYVTTWDFDGMAARYRPISPEGGPWIMGGGEVSDPYVMDDVGPILVPVEAEP